MGKKVNRVSYRLDSKGIKSLPVEDIRAIIRGADEMIMSGGRNLLVKVLKGSKAKKVLELQLDQSPVYGYFKEVKTEDILAKVDWCIENHFLRVVYDYRLPVIEYTPKGWEIEKDIYSDELLEKINEVCFTKKYDFVLKLKDRNRELIMLLLEKIEASENSQYIPVLEAWKEIEYKKVAKRINSVIRSLEASSGKKM